MCSGNPDISVIIVNWNTADITADCIDSVFRDAGNVSLEIIVIDNASEDGSCEKFENRFAGRIRLIKNDKNLGFAKANNQGIAIAKGDYVLLLNNDTLVLDRALEKVLHHVRNFNGEDRIWGCRLLNEDRSLQPSCYRFQSLTLHILENLYLHKLLPGKWSGKMLLRGYWDHDEEMDVDYIMGAFVFFKKSILDRIGGGLSEEFFMFAEDMEFGFRARSHGVHTRFYPGAEIIHLLNRSAGKKYGEDRTYRSYSSFYKFLRSRHGPFYVTLYKVISLKGFLLRVFLYSVFRRNQKDTLDTLKSALKYHIVSFFSNEEDLSRDR